MTRSKDGREWAHLSELKAGDRLIPDSGFHCLRAGGPVEVKTASSGTLYVECDDGRHYLDGQLDMADRDSLVGLWPCPRWTRVERDDSVLGVKRETLPTVGGWYAVRIAGDSESLDGHTIYDFPDYTTWATFVFEDDGEDGPCISFAATHDEELETVIAWYGPIDLPPVDCFREFPVD